jgi:hypothetical protein
LLQAAFASTVGKIPAAVGGEHIMKRGNILGAAWGLGLLSFAGLASAQEGAPPAAAPAPANGDGHASGLMVQGRMQAQGGLLSVGGGPSFVLGYQGPSFAVGVGLSLTRVGFSAGNDGSGSVTLFQVMPTALIDVWRSSDGRARANLIGGIGYGRGSVSVTDSGENCNIDNSGNEICTPSNDEQTVSAGFVPVMLGFGGDYFLARNFALGAEVGLQGAFTTGIDSKRNNLSQSVEGSANLQLAYGALRATFVLGD